MDKANGKTKTPEPPSPFSFAKECRDSLRLCLRPCHQPKAEDDEPEPTQKAGMV